MQDMLKDKIAIVGGGGSGMGEATAKLYASEGAKVVLMEYNAEAAEKVVKEIEEAGGEATFFGPCDVSKQDLVNELAAKTVEKYGRIDILCDYAGGTFDGAATQAGWTWQDLLEITTAVNQWGALYAAYAVVPYMKEQGSGVIILCSSNGAFNPTDPAYEYHMAKGAVESLTVNLAMGLAQYGIRVFCIKPGPIMSKFWKDLMGDDPDPNHELFKAIAHMEIPLGRVGTPDDIAGPALWMACDKLSGYVTGLRLYVAGGAGYVYGHNQSAIANLGGIDHDIK